VLQYGPDGEVVEPAAIRAAVRERLEGMARA
jgi:predicted DNA-binding transcriptional regulator YafY